MTKTHSKARELAQQVNAAFKKTDAVMMASDPFFVVTYLPTGIAPIDDLLQGGIPFGRFVEIFGDYSTLKSYIGLCAIRECQRMGKLAALIDTEHSFDPTWAKQIGVDIDDLIIKRPETGEEAIDKAETLIRGGVDFIVFDSVAAALPQQDKNKKMQDENANVAPLARLMSVAMRKLTAPNKKTGVLWINQTRVNVGVMFGSNEAVTGGKSLPFYASYRIAVRKAGKVTEDIEVHVIDQGKPKKKKIKQVVAQTIRATVEKSKLNAPHREIMFNFDFRKGEVDNWLYLAYKCLDEGILTVERGRWWLTKKPSVKYRGEKEARAHLSELTLRVLLGMEPVGSNSPGKQQSVGKRKVVRRKSASSKSVGQKSTRVQEPVGSKKTVRIKKRSTKSKTRIVRSRSKRKT